MDKDYQAFIREIKIFFIFMDKTFKYAKFSSKFYAIFNFVTMDAMDSPFNEDFQLGLKKKIQGHNQPKRDDLGPCHTIRASAPNEDVL